MSILTEAQKEQFHTDGFCILENVVPDAMLRLLRDECATFIRLKDEEMDRAGTDTLGISHRGSRYFVSNCHLVRPEINRFLHSDLMAGICRETLGPDAYMFYNQYVVKGAEAGMKFSWHQDSGYVNANGGDIQVTKHRFSGFWDTDLDAILRNLGVKTLLIGGVNLDQCVMTTLEDASFLGYDVILVEDCAATTSPAYCTQATLYNIKLLFGFVTRADQIIAALDA